MIQLPRLTQLKPRERLFAAGSGVVLVIVILDRLVLGPWAGHAQHVRQEIRQMERAIQSHQRLLVRKDRVMQELTRYQRYLQPAIADDLHMAALLKELQEMAGQSHVEVGEIKPLTVETAETLKRYPFEVRFQCTLEEWVQFVFLIETSPSLYEVTRASLTTQEDKPDRLEGSLRVLSVTVHAEAAPVQADARGMHAALRQ